MAVSVATAMLLGAVFAGDSVWTAIAVLAVAGGWSALALAGRMPVPGGGTVLLGLVLAIAVLEWAVRRLVGGARPLVGRVNRTLVFAGFLAVGLLLGASGQTACRLAAAALMTALGAAVVWALAGQGDSGALPGRRSRCAAARSDRLLERARARRRHAARTRADARGRCGQDTRIARGGRGARILPRSSRCCSRPPVPEWRGAVVGRGALALAPSRPGRGGAARARGSRARRPASRPGHSPGPHSSRTRCLAPIASPTARGSACCSSPEARSRRSRRYRFDRSRRSCGPCSLAR